MKGKTTCPQCCEIFVVDVPDDLDTTKINCPKCNHTFVIKRHSDKECGWEEHGEPRKTILSSFKKRTNRPTIASFLLFAAGVIGIFTGIILAQSNGSIIYQLGIFKSWFSNFDNVSLSIVVIICSIFAFIGSINSFKRQFLNFAVICAFISIFSIGLFFGTIFSIVALILIILSRDEFDNAAQGKIF